MTVSQTPILRNANQEKNAYRGFAMAQMRILIDYMRVAGLNVYSRVVRLENGVVITCKKCFDLEELFIDLPSAPAPLASGKTVIRGFLYHPRTGQILFNSHFNYYVDGPGFLPDDLTPLSIGVSIYPLVDNDNGTRNIWKESPQDDLWLFEADPPENYGNVWWMGEGDDPIVLSWKGPATRLLPFDPQNHYPGYTTFYEEPLFSGDYYTAFGPTVYSTGTAYITAPDDAHIVLGAAIGEAGLSILFGGNYRDRLNPDGGLGGFYVELYQSTPEGVARKSFIRSNRHLVPWMFSSDGSKAAMVEFGIPWTLDAITGQFAQRPAETIKTTVTSSGTLTNLDDIRDQCPTCPQDTELGTVGGVDITNTTVIDNLGSAILAAEYNGNDLIIGRIEVSAKSTSTNHYKKQGYITGSSVVEDLVQYSTFPGSWIDTFPPLSQVTSGGSVQMVAYFICNPVWSVNRGASINSAGVLTVPRSSACGPFTVTAIGDGGVTGSAVVGHNVMPLTVGFASNVNVGTVLSVSGGVLPISLTATNLSLSKTSETTWSVTAVTCTSGSIAITLITATDYCGTKATAPATLASGTWNQTLLTSHQYNYCYNQNCWDGLIRTVQSEFGCELFTAGLVYHNGNWVDINVWRTLIAGSYVDSNYHVVQICTSAQTGCTNSPNEPGPLPQCGSIPVNAVTTVLESYRYDYKCP